MSKKIKALIQNIKSKLLLKHLMGLAYADEGVATQPVTPGVNNGVQSNAQVAPTTSPLDNLGAQQGTPSPNNLGAQTQQVGQTQQMVQTQQGTQQAGQATNIPASNNLDIDSLIARARQEEKNKLYSEITALKADIQAKIQRANELHIELSNKDSEIANLKANSKKTEGAKVKDLELEVEKLRGELALKDNEINQIKLSSYKDLKVSQAGGQLIPELVAGSTIEEIDASIELAKQRYSQIVNNVQQTMSTKKPSTPNFRGDVVGATTGYPSVASPNVSAGSQSSTVNLSDINLFTPEGREQYKTLRNNLNIR